MSMAWTRSNSIGLAKAGCRLCHGVGMRVSRHGAELPCGCVFRSAFRACYNRFREFSVAGDRISVVSLEWCAGTDGRRSYSRKREEYRADFCLVSRRVLDDNSHRLFRLHFVLGAQWKLCCRQLRMDRGTFFHEVYQIEQRLGRVFCELQPYALFPLTDYFSPPGREMRAAA